MSDGSDDALRTWLSAIGDLTAAVNAGRSLREVLDLVARKARELLALDFCGVLVPDEDHRKLIIAGWSGLSEQYVERVNTDRPVRLEADADSGAPSSRAFRSGLPCAVVDIEKEPGFIWGGVAREQGYRSMLSVPLVTASGVIGTLNSYRTSVHVFGADEVERLQLLAEHAAIAITSARHLEDLRLQHELVTRSEEIHDRLLRVSVRAGGVAGIVDALHELLGSTVLVHDARGELLAAAGEEPTGRPDWGETGEDRPAGSELVRDEGSDVVVDVVLAGAVAARVRIPGRAGTLAALDRRALEHAAVVLALELFRRRTAAEAEQSVRGELLADLLAGADPAAPSIRDRAALLGHDLGRPHAVLVARVTAQDGAAAAGDTLKRAVTAASRLTAGVRPRPLISGHHDLVITLWPQGATEPVPGDALRSALASVPGVEEATVVVSDGTADLVDAYRTARGAVLLATRSGRRGKTVTLDDLGVGGLLLQLGDSARLRAFAERTLGALVRYDEEHGAELLRTLRVYLDAGLDRNATADLLTVHPNTVSQRMRRIFELTGLDWRDAHTMVDARSALVVLDVAAGSEQAIN
ncbi:helix-turn-helix domain-containing protein [Streptomyces sp. NPDC002519]